MKQENRSMGTNKELLALCRSIAARSLPVSLAALGLALAAPAQAATINVTAGAVDQANNGNCSIIEALLSANDNASHDLCTAGNDADSGGDIVALPAASTFTIDNAATGNAALPALTGELTIQGNGSTLAQQDGTLLRVGTITGNVIIDALNISGFKTGGIAVMGGSLTLSNSALSDNGAPGIYASGGTLDLSNCTISGSVTNAGSTGGGVELNNSSSAKVVNCTFSGNAVGSRGSAFDAVNYSSAVISHSTFAGNAGGQAAVAAYGYSSVTLANSIVANNSSPRNCYNGEDAALGMSDGGLSDDATCDGASIVTADAKLGPLADNGGPTQTIALLSGSPAINAAMYSKGGSVPPATDQRGIARPQFKGYDLGAFELAPVPDTTPEAFNFPNVNDVPVNTPTTSKIITLTGFNTPTAISVNAGEYSFDGKSWSSAAGTISPGDSLQLRLGSSKQVNTAKSMTVTVGGVSDTFGVKTTAYAGDVSPDDFHIVNSPNVAPNTPVTSRAIVPVGYDSAAPVTVSSGCFYIINNGTPGNTTGTILPTQTLKLRKQSPATNGTQFQCDVTVGSTKVRWIGKTAP